MPAEERVGGEVAGEYAGKEAAKGNPIPLLVLIVLCVVIFFVKRHFLKKYAAGKRQNLKPTFYLSTSETRRDQIFN